MAGRGKVFDQQHIIGLSSPLVNIVSFLLKRFVSASCLANKALYYLFRAFTYIDVNIRHEPTLSIQMCDWSQPLISISQSNFQGGKSLHFQYPSTVAKSSISTTIIQYP